MNDPLRAVEMIRKQKLSTQSQLKLAENYAWPETQTTQNMTQLKRNVDK